MFNILSVPSCSCQYQPSRILSRSCKAFGAMAILRKSGWAFLALAATINAQCDSDCKCFPGDDCWPTVEEWNDFNSTIDGKLIATVPLAAACHDSEWASYNNETCTKVQDSWLDPETQ